MLGTKRICRVRIAKDELDKMSKEDFQKSWSLQEQYIDYIEAKLSENADQVELTNLRESEEKLKHQQLESTRRENILVMRLTTKEQEMQEYAGQIQELKQAQISTLAQLRSTLVDPAVNLMFDRMRKEIETLKARLEETQNELSAWKFTPDSNTGKRLMAKCRLLYQENEELGKMISSGRLAKLEGDLALQKTFSEEMKKSQSELDEFLLELDEDVEGMQSTIYYLQQQLRESKDQIVKLQKENEKLSSCSPAENRSYVNSDNAEHAGSEPPKTPTNCQLEVSETALNNVESQRSPISADLNRTEEMASPKPVKGTNSSQPWSPPPPPVPVKEEQESKGHERSEQSQPMDLSVEVDSLKSEQVEEVNAVMKESQRCTEPVDSEPSTNAVAATVASQPAVPTVRGSLHMEAYDSEQEAETVSSVTTTSEGACSTSTSVTTSPPAASDATTAVTTTSSSEPTQKKAAEQVSRRTSRKRTRNSRSLNCPQEEDSTEQQQQQPTVKRLRRREIVVDHENAESEQKRTQLQIDSINDAEVQAAQTLATLASSAKHERKDIRAGSQDHLPDSVGNGELKGTRVCENLT